MGGSGGLEPDDGAEIDQRGIDPLAACQGCHDLGRGVAQALAVDADILEGLCVRCIACRLCDLRQRRGLDGEVNR